MALKKFALLAASRKLFLLIFLQFLHFVYQSRHFSLHPHVSRDLGGHASAPVLAPPPLLDLSISWVSLKCFTAARIAAEFTVLCLCFLEAF